MDVPFQGDDRAAAVDLGRLLEEHRGGDVMTLDLRELNIWTDFFVIATVSSGVHLQGLDRRIKEFAAERGIEVLNRRRKPAAGDEWSLVDLGTIVVHLMSAASRSFYELERLWGAAPVIYSSKSS